MFPLRSVSLPARDSVDRCGAGVEERAVQHSANPMVGAPEPGAADELARYFPDVKRVCLRASVSPVSGGRVRETVLVEFAGAGTAIFSSRSEERRVGKEWRR